MRGKCISAPGEPGGGKGNETMNAIQSEALKVLIEVLQARGFSSEFIQAQVENFLRGIAN